MTSPSPNTSRALFVVALVALVVPAAYGQDTYHILVTNDDGIQSPGIQVLAQKLRDVGQVHVVAPCGERSGSSMSVNLRAELHVRPIPRDGNVVESCVDTSPAGAALLAITTLAPESGYDIVISGINRGANVGTVSHMSGTIGGAMMGAYYGIPAIAASLGGRSRDFDYAANFIAKFVRELRERPAMPGIVFSINIPHGTESEITGVAFSKMAGAELEFAYEQTESTEEGRTFSPRIGFASEFPDNSDSEAYSRGMISITPLQFDWTAYSVLERLRGWSIGHEIN